MEEDGRAEIVFYDAITPGDSDFNPTLSRMRPSEPEAIYFTGYYPEAGLVLRQARNLGIDALFIGGNAAINDEFIAIAGAATAAGSIVTQEPLPVDLPYPEAQDFLATYRDRHGEAPSTPWPVYAADALLAIAAAIEGTGSTNSQELAAYLRSDLEDLPGFTGPIAFDENGDRMGAMYLAYVVTEDGELTAF